MVTERKTYSRSTKALFFVLAVSFIVGGVQSVARGADPFALAGSALLVVCGLALYFLPTLYANYKQHPQSEAIAALNILAGWTLVGWIAAAVWASTKPKH
jgi:uncharacterized membrane protein